MDDADLKKLFKEKIRALLLKAGEEGGPDAAKAALQRICEEAGKLARDAGLSWEQTENEIKKGFADGLRKREKRD